MNRSIATAVAGLMFVLGVALVSAPKSHLSGVSATLRLKPSAEMVRTP